MLESPAVANEALAFLQRKRVNVVYLYAEYRALRRDRDPRWQESKGLFDEALGSLYDISRRHTDQAGQIVPEPVATNSWLYEMD